VRRLTIADAEAGAELLRALQSDIGYRPTVSPAEVREWLQWGDLVDDSWAFEEDGRLTAFGWVFKHGEIAEGGGFVRPEARGRGLGTELVERSEDWARRKRFEMRRRGLTVVRLGVDSENPSGATRLYERAGMSVATESVVYERTLP
jgi:GNAT superfamily N-acetyltransferase